jgi:hypothetical protein
MTATEMPGPSARPHGGAEAAQAATPRSRTYLELSLDLRPLDRRRRAFEIAVLPSQVGESSAVRVPYRPSELKPGLQLLAAGGARAADLIPFGERLAQRLLPEGEVRDLFRAALTKAGREGGVRLRLIVHDRELAQLPWEYAYLQRHRGEPDPRHFLLLDPRVSLVRHEPLPEAQPLLLGATPDRLRMVAASANVAAYPALDLAKERRVVETALADFNVDGIELEAAPFVEDATRAALSDALRGGADIFHFAGHGEFRERHGSEPDEAGRRPATGALVVASPSGSQMGETIEAGELGMWLRQAGIRLAVLGACDSARRDGISAWTSIGPALVEAGVAAVVAMQDRVGDRHAIAFSRTFYRAVAAGLSVDEAVSLGRLAMYGEGPGNAQWGIPVLSSRAPDGQLFPRPEDRPSRTAAELRTVVRQTVETIEAGGTLTGIRGPGGADGGPVEVLQEVGTLRGEAVGIDGARPRRRRGEPARAGRRRERAAEPTSEGARVDQRVNENLGSLTAIRDSVIHGDVLVELEVGAQVYLLSDASRGSVTSGGFDREASPFPGLRPFAFETRAFFRGRDGLVGELERTIASRAVTVVQGPSGAGKTSLLMAGLAPRALERGLLLVRLEDYDDPAATLRQVLASQAERLSLELGENQGLAATLRAVTTGTAGTLVLVLDQFERLFLLSAEAQAALIAELATALAEAGPLLRVVLSVREDVYGRLTEVAAPLPGLFERSIRVDRLSRAEAALAIREPLLRHGAVAFDEPFVETLLDDLDALSGPPPGEIEPGQLQIVCAALFERARALRDQDRSPVISAELYGDGAEAISLGYLEERLRAGLGDDRDVAESVLRSILSSRADDWLAPGDLRVDAADGQSVEGVLRRLVKLGVLVDRRVTDVEYSVATPAIESILARLGGPSVIEQRRAADVLEAVGVEWRVRRAVARRGQLRLLAAAPAGLVPTWSEAAILLRSAVVQHEPAGIWRAALARHGAETARLELEQPSGTPDPAASALIGPDTAGEAAGDAAGEAPSEPSEGFGAVARAAVISPEAQDRETAALALSTVPDFEIRLQRALMLVPPARRRDREIELWAALMDAGVEAGHVIDGFGPIQRVRLRLRRGRRELSRGRRLLLALAAAAGAGMGVALGIVRFLEALVTDNFAPLGELLFWLMWGGLLGAATAGAVLVALAARGRRAAPGPGSGPRPVQQPWNPVPIAAGAAAFGLALFIVAVGNGLDPAERPLMPLLGFVAGIGPAWLVAAGGFPGSRRAAAAAILGTGLVFAAVQAVLLVVDGRSAALPFLHSATFYSGALGVRVDVLPIVEGFVVGTAIAAGIALALRRAKEIVDRWERLEALAGE